MPKFIKSITLVDQTYGGDYVYEVQFINGLKANLSVSGLAVSHAEYDFPKHVAHYIKNAVVDMIDEDIKEIMIQNKAPQGHGWAEIAKFMDEYAYSFTAQQKFVSKGGVVGKVYDFPSSESVESQVSTIKNAIPDIDKVVKMPLVCQEEELCVKSRSVWYAIQHLNDFHKWSREDIASWLEEISDPTGQNGPNLAFG